MKNENKILKKGTAFPLVESLLSLNKYTKDPENFPLVEVVIISRNSPDTGLRILNSIESYKLPITRSFFSSGHPITPFIKPFKVHLFLSKNKNDIQALIDSKVCAAAQIYNKPKKDFKRDDGNICIAFDADSVIFSEEAEAFYKFRGLEEFKKREREKSKVPLKPGPFAKFLIVLHTIQKKFDDPERCPLQLGIVTARNSPAHKRVINTLRQWGVSINQLFFLGGIPKDKILEAYNPHIFFDDQEIHLKNSSKIIASGKVPYSSDSVLSDFHSKQ